MAALPMVTCGWTDRLCDLPQTPPSKCWLVSLVSTGWASVPASRYPKVRRQVVALWVVASADWHRRLVDLVCDDRPPTQPGIVELKGNIAADRKGEQGCNPPN